MQFKTFLASDYVNLDSDVHYGGGNDATAQLQALLNFAGEDCGVRLIMDGAALISSLELSSNTIIECLSKSCGFYQMDNTNAAIITTKLWNYGELSTKNVAIIGGTYNQNCLNQAHDVIMPCKLFETQEARKNAPKGKTEKHYIFGFEFYGVENLTIKDVTVMDFRTFGILIGGFNHVNIENVWFTLNQDTPNQNQDGLHFWGPGKFLTVKNVGGTVGDDFMNIGPDEHDGKSSITDVIVDGVYLEHADQACRLLSRDKGRLDRVTLRNISGTYKSFGFYILPWFRNKDQYGNFGNIFIENVDLRAEDPNYTYRPPILFAVGGNIESITFKNIRHHIPGDSRTVFDLGAPYSVPTEAVDVDVLPKLKNVFIEDFKVIENDGSAKGCDYIHVYYPIDNLVISNAYIMRECSERSNTLLSFKYRGTVGNLIMNGVYTYSLEKLIDGEDKIERKILSYINTL